jgi:ABC-type glycerol-3-phosphate transport system substrate-binding protein
MKGLPRSVGALVAVLVASASLTACGNSDSGASNTTKKASAPASPAAASSVPAGQPVGKFSGVTINVSRWAGDPWEGIVRQAAKDWSAATGGKVNVDVSAPDLRQKQVLGFTKKTGEYDVAYVLPNWFGEYVSNGFLRPIDDYLNDPSKNTKGFSTSQYNPIVFKQGNVDGKQYSIQDFVSTVGLAYRKDVLQAAGIAPPRNWDEVLAAAQKLNGKNGMAGITIPGKKSFGSITDLMSTLLINQGKWWYGPDGKATVDVPTLTTALKFYASLGKLTPKGLLNFHYDEEATAAANGKAAMIVANTPSFAWLNDPKRSKTVGKWGFVAMAAPNQAPSGQLMYWHWAIPADAKNPAAAYSFIQYVTSEKVQDQFAVKGATLGPEQSMYGDNSTIKEGVPFLPVLDDMLARNEPQPNVKTWPQAQDAIETIVQAMLSGKESPDAAAKAMASKLQDALK